MDTPALLLHADGALLLTSKSALFRLSLEAEAAHAQDALQHLWQGVHALQQRLHGWQPDSGKLLLDSTDSEDSTLSSARLPACRFSTQAGAMYLQLEINAELVFDFQSSIWTRLRSLATTLDILQQHCQQLRQETVTIHLRDMQLKPARS